MNVLNLVLPFHPDTQEEEEIIEMEGKPLDMPDFLISPSDESRDDFKSIANFRNMFREYFPVEQVNNTSYDFTQYVASPQDLESTETPSPTDGTSRYHLL